jgi:hypothetical protein
MMTVTEIVRCMMPLRAAAAPRKAYVPGVIQGTSGSHDAKKAELGKCSYSACTIIPTMRPKDAPMAIEGTKIPAGTLHPYEMMTRPVRRIVATANESTMTRRFSFLEEGLV